MPPPAIMSVTGYRAGNRQVNRVLHIMAVASGRREPAGKPRYWARPICCLCTAAS